MTTEEGFETGEVIAGRYRLGRFLDAGGMGVVWEAEDRRLGRRVAVKLIRPGCRATARFLREAKIMARLPVHPHIVTVHDLVEEPLLLVMELVRGTPLDVHVRLGGRPDPSEIVAWGVQICDALSVVHAEDVVHRDLKPSNLMLTGEGGRTLKVLDFGVAALLDGDTPRLTAEGAFVGTPGYAAPEQRWRAELDGRADLYSLGCVLHELAVGMPPLGSTANWNGRPDISAGFRDVVGWLLEEDPEARPRDAAEVRRLLTALTPPGRLRIARVFDLHTRDGGPAFGRAHPRIDSAEERADLLECLRDGRPFMFLQDEPDRVEPNRGRVVPAHFRTDGTWVWSDQIAYYLQRYGYAPDPELRRYFATRPDLRPDVTPPSRGEAVRLIMAESEGSLTGRPKP
ncbi:serine/threonine-protein kinase [Streptomyces griseorubiginosus]|uniref:non-specific serine/threonine protein kinase n=1 Tax=Streptomyces griseorubiginosus TaxID=67304 RepID=A0AAI8L394_9ACTN|nr:serine/threonine-protein kinase [Streptomyces griseorubiginosus]AYC40558.1 Serine/threonine-protein kinase PknA [Streptomyces griseorubiginosus]